MRILFTFVGGNGHFQPLVSIARAAEAAGHTVAFACGPSIASTVKAGFTTFVMGNGDGRPPERRALSAVDTEREDQVLREEFARREAGTRASGILALCTEWQPDLVVCEEMDFGGVIAAEVLDLPHATVLCIASGSFVRTEVVGEPLNEVRAEHGLPPDPDLEMFSRYLVLSPFPPSYRDPAFPLPATAHSLRPLAAAPTADDAAPTWLADLPGAPTVYFTLGTIFNMESGDLFTRVLNGLRDLPINLIVTVGRHIDPAKFGPQPANVHIERYIPQAAVLPQSTVVVSHGGSGSVIGALAHGLPMVLIPMGADQPQNAARCAELGVAEVLDAVDATPEAVREAVSRVLADPAYRQAAGRLREESAALSGPAYAVTLLERLAAEKRPVLVV